VIEPTPPTEEEIEAFDAWQKRYEEVMAEGDKRNWLHQYTYDDGPQPRGPLEYYAYCLAEWQRSERLTAQYVKEQKRKKLIEKADAAAKKARDAVLNGK
jgi:hypothetical protein